MAEHPIQWLNMPGYKGETLNPIRATYVWAGETRVGWHCEKVGPGCLHCYAESMNLAARFRGTGFAYHKRSRERGITISLDRPTLEKPLHWKKPRMIFWCDMTDLFGEWVPDEWIDDCIGVMSMTQQHIHCLLTKRPKRMAKYMRTWWPEYLEHIWLGTSVSTQADANKNIPELLKCPAAIRFVSLEPLLERVDARDVLCGNSGAGCRCACPCEDFTPNPSAGRERQLDLAIFGGESGRDARPCDINDIRFGVEQFRVAGVPVFVKQLGSVCLERTPLRGKEWPEETLFQTTPLTREGDLVRVQLKHPKGGDPEEWPSDLQDCREWPVAKGASDGSMF